MKIRNVSIQDITQVKAIADRLAVSTKNESRRTGFYDYPITISQYERRSESPLFLVSCRDSDVEGFCMAYDSNFIKRLIEKEPTLREDVVFKYLDGLEGDFVYLDQLAVKGVGTMGGSVVACNLVDRLIALSGGKKFIEGFIVHRPWKNEGSIKFFTHKGARLMGEVQSDKIVFGIYRKDLC